KSDVVKVELATGAKPEEKLVLERDANDPDKWRLPSHYNAPVDKTKAETFVENVVGLKGEPRATAADEASLAAYDLGAEKALHVTVYKKDAADPVAKLLVGKAPAFNQIFMRQDGSMDVFVVDKNLKSDAGIFGEGEDQVPTATSW